MATKININKILLDNNLVFIKLNNLFAQNLRTILIRKHKSLRNYNEQTAQYLFKKFEAYLKPVDVKILIKAVKFRQENKKENLSFFDCVGYVYALENNMNFVTGDKEFKNKDNVEFVK